MLEQGADIKECDRAVARSVSATGFHVAMNCCGVIADELPRFPIIGNDTQRHYSMQRA